MERKQLITVEVCHLEDDETVLEPDCGDSYKMWSHFKPLNRTYSNNKFYASFINTCTTGEFFYVQLHLSYL